MKSATTRFIIASIALSALCALLLMAWNYYMPETKNFRNGYILILVFAITVTAVHLFLLRAASASPQTFIRGFMVATIIKFFFFLSALVIFVLFVEGNKKVIILHFLFYYAIFTVLEVGILQWELGKLKGAD